MRHLKEYNLFESASLNGGYYCSLWTTARNPDGEYDGEIIMYAPTEKEIIKKIWEAFDNTITTQSLEELDFNGPDDIKSIYEFAELIAKISESGFEENTGCENPDASLTIIENIDDFRDLLGSITEHDAYVDDEDDEDDYDFEEEEDDDGINCWLNFDGDVNKMVDLFVQALQGGVQNEDLVLGFFFNKNHHRWESEFRFITFSEIWKLFLARTPKSKITEYLLRRIGKSDTDDFIKFIEGFDFINYLKYANVSNNFDDYFKKNPTALVYLDSVPEVKAGIIARTGLDPDDIEVMLRMRNRRKYM
jgi:hypothetical protein